MLFGEKQVLAPAKQLINDREIVQCSVGMIDYVHILFNQHEIIWAEDCLCESFYLSDLSFSTQDEEQREELKALFPELIVGTVSAPPLARMALKSHEAALLLSV